MIRFVPKMNAVATSTWMALASALATTPPARSQDVVHFLRGDDGQTSRATGEINRYDADELQLRTPSGRAVTVPSDAVTDIESEWTPEHVAGDRLLAGELFGEALDQFALAAKKEPRAWAVQRILAQAVWCYRALDETDRAADLFLRIVRRSPNTPYLDAMPVEWRSRQPTPSGERKAVAWLQDDIPAVRLLGASMLLTGRHRSSAAAALSTLTADSDHRIVALAQAQLWRTQVVTAGASDVAQWEAAVSQFPERLRAGPYYVLGKVLARHGRHEAAALCFLRVPIVYERDRGLAAESLLSAADQLEELKRPSDAIRLYREVVQTHSGSVPAQQASKRLLLLNSNAPG